MNERRILSTIVAAGLFVALPVLGCSSSDQAAEDVSSTAEDLAGATAVNRAMEWVDAKLHYCQAPNHARDYDSACSRICDRKDDKAWNPYRSDCSGLVSWAWELEAPGRTTFEFAPHDDAVSKVIRADDLAPGDAVNIWQDHIMLFKRWEVKGKSAVFIEEPGCSSNPPHAHEFSSAVSLSGSDIYVHEKGATFVAIRRK